MALDPQLLPPVPEATAAAVQAAFPRGISLWLCAPSSSPSMTISSLVTCIRLPGVLWKSCQAVLCEGGSGQGVLLLLDSSVEGMLIEPSFPNKLLMLQVAVSIFFAPSCDMPFQRAADILVAHHVGHCSFSEVVPMIHAGPSACNRIHAHSRSTATISPNAREGRRRGCDVVFLPGPTLSRPVENDHPRQCADAHEWHRNSPARLHRHADRTDARMSMRKLTRPAHALAHREPRLFKRKDRSP